MVCGPGGGLRLASSVRLVTSFTDFSVKLHEAGIRVPESASGSVPKRRRVKHIKHTHCKRTKTKYFIEVTLLVFMRQNRNRLYVHNFSLLPEQPMITLMCLTLSSFSVFGFFPAATENSLGLMHEEHREKQLP